MSTEVGIKTFVDWCTTRGVDFLAPLTISQVTKLPPFQGCAPVPMRGVIATEDISHGKVIATIPYSACINAETIAPTLAMQHVLPPLQVVHKALRRRFGMRPYEASHHWLAMLLAMQIVGRPAITPSSTPPSSSSVLDYGPYLDTFLPLSAACARASAENVSIIKNSHLSAEECNEYEYVSDVTAHASRLVSKMIDLRMRNKKKVHQLQFAAPNHNAVDWCYRTVISRNVILPLHCFPSAPESLPELLEGHEIPVLPSLVPFLDLINCPSSSSLKSGSEDPNKQQPQEGEGQQQGGDEQANIELYTVVDNATFHIERRAAESKMNKYNRRMTVRQEKLNKKNKNNNEAEREREVGEQGDDLSFLRPISQPVVPSEEEMLSRVPLADRKIALVAGRPIAAGSELLLSYEGTESRGTFLFRFGFLPEG